MNPEHLCVYFARLGGGEVKIGSTKQLPVRLRQLARQYGTVQLIHTITSDRPNVLETYLVRLWRDKAVSGREVLMLSDDDIQWVRQVSRVIYGEGRSVGEIVGPKAWTRAGAACRKRLAAARGTGQKPSVPRYLPDGTNHLGFPRFARSCATLPTGTTVLCQPR